MGYNSSKDTKKHIKTVRRMIWIFVKALFKRALKHDASKLQSMEKETFDIYTPKLKNCTYGSDEYKEFLKEMDTALQNHYFHNPHHPEHHLMFPEHNCGVTHSVLERMSLIDIVEMLMDWKAASMRHTDGDIMKSIDINQKRFSYSKEWSMVFKNTIEQL